MSAPALAVIVATCWLSAQPNLVFNGSFEADSDGDGLADGWVYAAGVSREKAPEVKLLRAAGKVGQWCQGITCTRFTDGHVMLAQVGRVAVKARTRYRISFWARGEDAPRIRVALRDTATWQDLGLSASFSVASRWRRFEFSFVSPKTLQKTTRLQFWYLGTGTLWLDDVVMVETEGGVPEEHIWTWPAARRNGLYNSSFELGSSGWFTLDYWTLYGETVQAPAVHGQRCLRISTDPQGLPVDSFDYYEPRRRPLERLLVANKYWVEVKPGEQYTFSAYARASRPTQAIIGVRFTRGEASRKIALSPQAGWQRYELPFKARGRLAMVIFGPLPAASSQQAGQVWIDALQLERGAKATEYRLRRPFEVAAYIDPWRSVTEGRPEPVRLKVVGWNDTGAKQSIRVKWRVEDMWEKEAGSGARELSAGPGELVRWEHKLGEGERAVAFARVHVEADGERLPVLRSAAVLSPADVYEDTAFGINHAFRWDEWLKLCKRMGIMWVRDWTLKWQYVEPEKGRFELEKADYYIDRPLRLGMKELCMFPFPSAVWAAEEPPQRPRKERKLYRPIQTAFRPKDISLFKNYISRCVSRYRDRIKHWEIFNESIFTSYSLPRSYGYVADDYVPLLRAAWEGIKRVDSRAKVIGGYSAPPGAHLQLYSRMIELGGLQWCDAVSIHEYPRGEPEGSDAAARRLVEAMRGAGQVKPMWLTEFAYYADDDVSPTKSLSAWPLLQVSELVQAAWTVRYCALMLGSGVEKIFFHIWSSRVGWDNGAGLFFEADGEPHKVAVALAAMVRLLGPQPAFFKSVKMPGEGQRCLMFRRGNTVVSMAWDQFGETECKGVAPEGRWYDMAGQPLRGRPGKLGPYPIYLVSSRPVAQIEPAIVRWVAGAAGGR